jgi:hypothetical protein
MSRYLRLVITELDVDSLRPQGIFTPSYTLFRSGSLPFEQHEQLKRVLHWFERNLPVPDRSQLDPKAIFWFKAGAPDLLNRIWPMARLLEHRGYHVEFVKTRKPGYVIYEDDLQLAAIPFADTF